MAFVDVVDDTKFVAVNCGDKTEINMLPAGKYVLVEQVVAVVRIIVDNGNSLA